MGSEYELKFRATARQLQRIQAAFPGEWRRIPMKTTYYDTPDGALSARRWTLRSRMEGGRKVCTLKTPAAGGARGEWEVEGCEIESAIPLLAERSGLSRLRELTKGGLVVSCGAEFVRLALTMPMEGCIGELALDEGVLRNGSRELAFAEAEAELKQGEKDCLDRFGQLLEAQFQLQRESRSKFLRAKLLGQEENHGI